MRFGGYVFTVAMLVVAATFSANLIFTIVTESQRSSLSDYSESQTDAVQRNGTVVKVPAVDTEGRGLVGMFEVEAVHGTGKTLTNIDHILFFVETQHSIQTAKAVAANVTGLDIGRYNIVYDVETRGGNSTVVSGPSAGAALAIATIAELQGIELDPDVMVTGSIRPDGTIGKVGGVPEKLRAAKEAGAKVFLVPAGQGIRDAYKVEKSCERVGRLNVCRTEYVGAPSLRAEDGVIVREVSDVREALKYFVN